MSDCCAWLISLVAGENDGVIKQILKQFSDDNCTVSCPMDRGMGRDDLLKVIYYRYYPNEKSADYNSNSYIRNFNTGRYEFTNELGQLVRDNKEAILDFIRKNRGGRRSKRRMTRGKRRKTRRGKRSKKTRRR
jgi:hypothetical protein